MPNETQTTKAIATVPSNGGALQTHHLAVFGREQLELLKRTICKGATDDEFELFVGQCKRTGLDPFAKQIHAVKRWSKADARHVMSIQVGIDGYRLCADRTGNYLPGGETVFDYDGNGDLHKATAFVRKFAHGMWHEVAGTAYWEEYVQTDKEGQPNSFWRDKPHLMLAKCAEVNALRRAFPQECSGLEDEVADLPERIVDVDQTKPKSAVEQVKQQTRETMPRPEPYGGPTTEAHAQPDAPIIDMTDQPPLRAGDFNEEKRLADMFANAKTAEDIVAAMAAVGEAAKEEKINAEERAALAKLATAAKKRVGGGGGQ